ncbi:hypothetical protein [Pseudomonas syringae]|uniref:hypothetical protein n=1 Tax=Pseudomonas syringae TaxID=317 RepID=UPI000E31404E|nr:hypothetical protein [Pseudomonas syringae]
MSDAAENKAIQIAIEASTTGFSRWDCDLAEEHVRAARAELKSALETVYPSGIRVIAELGGHKVKVEIISHHWAEQGELRGFNVKTGAVRKFHFSAIHGVVI